MGPDQTAPSTIVEHLARRTSLNRQPGSHRQYPPGAEDRCAVMRPAHGVSRPGDVLAVTEALGRRRHVAPPLARVHREVGRARAAAVRPCYRWYLVPAKETDIGLTERGTGSKCIVIARYGRVLGYSSGNRRCRGIAHGRHPRRWDAEGVRHPRIDAFRHISPLSAVSPSPVPIVKTTSVADTEDGAICGRTAITGSSSGTLLGLAPSVDCSFARALDQDVSRILSARLGACRAAEATEPGLDSFSKKG